MDSTRFRQSAQSSGRSGHLCRKTRAPVMKQPSGRCRRRNRMQRIVILLGVFAVGAAMVAAQAPPSFEVASVKPNAAPGNNVFIQMQPSGRLAIRGVPLRQIINWAYQLRPDDERLIDVPEWTRTERFDVNAKAPEGTPLGSINPVGPPSPGLLMLRTLLAERFQLRIRTETRR